MKLLEAYIPKAGTDGSGQHHPGLQLTWVTPDTAYAHAISKGYHLVYPSWDGIRLTVVRLPSTTWVTNRSYCVEILCVAWMFAKHEA